MSQHSDIEITIEYQQVGQAQEQIKTLELEDYFDLEPDEQADLDSCPHYNHAMDYLDLDSEQIQFTRLIVANRRTLEQRVILEKFWNQGRNRIIERTDSGRSPYAETILEIQISQSPPVWEILRLGQENGSLTPLYHAFLQDNDDGSQTETIVADMPQSESRLSA
jgi:hypothetical protein